VAPNFSIGIDAEVSYGDNKGYGATSLYETASTHLSGGVRFGLNVPMGHLLSWYPRLTIGIQSDHSDTQTISVFNANAIPAPASSISSVGPWTNLFAPFLVHLAPHFFVGMGPRLERNFGAIHGGPYDGAQTTLVSVDAAVGGWWGGSQDPDPSETRPPEGPWPKPQFGDRGEIVFTGATTAAISSFSYSSSSASSVSANLSPGFDYFVADGWSIGVNASVSYSGGTSFDSGGVKTDFSETSFGVAPRVGADIRLTRDLLSLWPQAEIGFGTSSNNQTTAAGSNNHTKGRSWVQASVPLLLHAATHFFLGVGPYVYHELADSDQNQVENDATAVGARFLLGGWF
jgi:hypothetical protein